MGSLNCSKQSRVDLESSLFFVSSPLSRKSSINQKLAPISCAGNILSIRAPANRGIGREAVLGKTVVHRSRARREEQARGEEQDTDFGCMCVGTCRKYPRKVQKTQRNLYREIYLGTQ